VSLIFRNGPSINTRNLTSSTHGASGHLHHENSVTERRNVEPIGHARGYDVLKYGIYQSPHREGNELPHHSSHKPYEISRTVKFDNLNCPDTTVLRDRRNVESEVITNSKRAFLPRTFSNKSNSLDNHHDTQQNYCVHDNSVTNRKPDRFAYQLTGSQNTCESNESVSPKNIQNNESDKSVWNENSSNRNFYGSAYHSRSGVDKCRMEKNNYKRHQKKNNSQRKCCSETESERKSRPCCHKEASSPLSYAHQQITRMSADPFCILQERTDVDCLASIQDSVANNQEAIVAPSSPSSLFSSEQEKDRDVKASSGPDLGHKSGFSLQFIHHPGNHNLETRSDGKSAGNHFQSVNFRDDAEGTDAFKAQMANMKEGEIQGNSVFDLYSLVHSQNDQLKHLQAQVDRLLLMRDRNSSVSTSACCCHPFTGAGMQSAKKHIMVVNESTQTVVNDSQCDVAVNTDPTPVVSVGVMTSFTDAADSQQSQKVKRMTRLRSDNR
jgi:hypothetical protein